MAPLLSEATLPDFKPKKDVVSAANGSMTAIEWAFSSTWPCTARGIFAGGGVSNETLRANATPAMAWTYSLMHLAHHYHSNGIRKFAIGTEDTKITIYLEISS